jgi:hypothetical protein
VIERFSKSLGFRADPNDPLRIVPSGGVSSWLILATAAIMAFLAAIAFAFAFSAARIADHWTADLARSATVRISVPADQIDAQTQRALEVLNTTPGIESASVVETSDQEALLAPWLGGVIALDEIDLPRLIAVVESPEGPDREGLRLRLAGEVPGARYDDHGQWRRPIVRTAGNVWRLSMASIALGFAHNFDDCCDRGAGLADVARALNCDAQADGRKGPFYHACFCPAGHGTGACWRGAGDALCGCRVARSKQRRRARSGGAACAKRCSVDMDYHTATGFCGGKLCLRLGDGALYVAAYVMREFSCFN